jgi:hypothetical protein
MFDTNLIELLNWAYSLIGVKYVWVCNVGLQIINHIPLYGQFDKVPSEQFIRFNGCNCVGLINLLRLKNNKNIPGCKDNEIKKLNYTGSIGLWVREMRKNDVLLKFNEYAQYDIGTLLIKPTNINSFGHMAIVIGHNKILHSYAYIDGINNNTFPGISISNLNDFSFDFVCPSSFWLYHNF